MSTLAEFEFMVLAALMRVGDEAYGVPVRDELDRSTGRDTSMGAVYSTLNRLEKKGLVTSDFGPSTPERGGKARRYFRVEAAGVDALKRSIADRAAILEGLDMGAV